MSLLLSILPFLTLVHATTDLADCIYVEGTYTPTWGTSIAPWATRTYYIEDTGEICSRPDCGGGRAPVKTDIVGCDSYEGTSIYVPQFLDLESLKLETPSAVLLDGPPRGWTATVTATTTSEGGEGSVSATSGQTAPTDEPEPTTSSTEARSTESEEGAESSEPTGAAAIPTAGGVMGLVAGAAVLGML